MTRKDDEPNMSSAVLDVFENKVFSGEFREGSFFSENDIMRDVEQGRCKEDDLDKPSKAVVREVILSLTKSGLLEQRPRVGTQIQTFDRNSKNTFTARRIFEEQLAVSYLIDILDDPDSDINDDHLYPLYNAIKDMQHALTKGKKPDLVQFFRSDLQFHSSISLIAGVPQYAEGIRGLYLITFLTVNSRLALNADIIKMVSSCKSELVSQHKGILDAIIRRDKSEALTLIRRHIQGADEFWKLAFSKQEEPNLPDMRDAAPTL